MLVVNALCEDPLEEVGRLERVAAEAGVSADGVRLCVLSHADRTEDWDADRGTPARESVFHWCLEREYEAVDVVAVDPSVGAEAPGREL